jgi:DNA-binding transcriptional MerR regulator
MAEVDYNELWNTSEIAELFGVGVSTVSNWKIRGFMPTPQITIKGMDLYSTTQVQRLSRERGISGNDIEDRVKYLLSLVEKFKKS